MNPFETTQGSDYLRKPLPILLLLSIIVTTAHLTATKGLVAGIGIMILPFAIVYMGALFINPRIGIVTILIFNFFVLGIGRYIPMTWGLLMDGLMVLMYLALFFKAFRIKIPWERANSQLTLLVTIWFGYAVLQIANPEAVSVAAWFYAMRGLALYQWLFVPLVFMDGRIGALFTEFAMATSAAVIFSSITALTLSPALCSKVLKPSSSENRFTQWMDKQFTKLENGYRKVLQDNLNRRFSLLAVLVLAGFATYTLMKQIPSELTPREDRGTFFVMMNGPEGASYENNAENMAKIEERLLPYVEAGELSRVLVRVPGWGGRGGVAIVGMPDWDERKRSTWQVMGEISGKMREVTDVRAFAIMRRGIGGGGQSRPIEFVLQGNDYEELVEWRDKILAKARQNKGLVRLDHDYKETFPQFLVSIDKLKAADLGVSVSDIGRTLETMLGQRRVTTFIDRGEEYDVILKGTKADFAAPNDIADIFVKSRTGELIPLDSLITVTEEATASRLNRYNRMRAITITANLADGYTLAEALDFLNTVAAEENHIDGAVDYKGESKLFYEGESAMTYVFLLALTVTFLVLAAQFESFVHPLVIMLTVPLGLVGAMYGLFITDSSLNIYSQIGIVMLIGLSAKNGILIVEFANQLRDKGIAFEQALVDAAVQRLRPIIMTSLTTVMSAIPLVFATGPGSESRMVIGVVIFAGVSVATILTLFIIPCAYSLLARKTQSPEFLSQKIAEQARALEEKNHG